MWRKREISGPQKMTKMVDDKTKDKEERGRKRKEVERGRKRQKEERDKKEERDRTRQTTKRLINNNKFDGLQL